MIVVCDCDGNLYFSWLNYPLFFGDYGDDDVIKRVSEQGGRAPV